MPNLFIIKVGSDFRLVYLTQLYLNSKCIRFTDSFLIWSLNHFSTLKLLINHEFENWKLNFSWKLGSLLKLCEIWALQGVFRLRTCIAFLTFTAKCMLYCISNKSSSYEQKVDFYWNYLIGFVQFLRLLPVEM